MDHCLLNSKKTTSASNFHNVHLKKHNKIQFYYEHLFCHLQNKVNLKYDLSLLVFFHFFVSRYCIKFGLLWKYKNTRKEKWMIPIANILTNLQYLNTITMPSLLQEKIICTIIYPISFTQPGTCVVTQVLRLPTYITVQIQQ